VLSGEKSSLLIGEREATHRASFFHPPHELIWRETIRVTKKLKKITMPGMKEEGGGSGGEFTLPVRS